MNSVLTSKLKITLLALGLSATAAPTWAATDITFCDEINQPGSYRVTQDLSCQSCPQCLLIDASNVTIDLQGHTISGDGSTTSTGIAVPRNSTLSNIAVHDGTVTSFVVGISLAGVRGARVERMRVFDNKKTGIVADANSVVASNIAVRNGGIGIIVGLDIGGGGSLVVDNLVAENGGTGLSVDAGSVVRSNVASFNGLTGIAVLCPSSISDNTTLDNNKTRPGQGFLDLTAQGSGCQGANNAPPQIR